MKDGQEPAFPLKGINTGHGFEHHLGMSKRFYAACAAMQGLLSNAPLMQDLAKTSSDAKNNRGKMIELSFDFADELLKQEHEKV